MCWQWQRFLSYRAHPVAQTSPDLSGPYRRLPACRALKSAIHGLFTRCRLEIGDTAGLETCATGQWFQDAPSLSGGSRRLPYDRPCDQSDGYPERNVDQCHVEREDWFARLKPEISRAAHREEEQEQRRHWNEEVKEPDKIESIPDGLYKEPEQHAP